MRVISSASAARPRISWLRVTIRPLAAKHCSIIFARTAGSRSFQARMYVSTAIWTVLCMLYL